MRKILFVFIVSVLVLSGCVQRSNEGFQIQGNIAGSMDGMKVFLEDVRKYPPVIVDSTVIKGEHFKFQGRLDLPGSFAILIDKTGQHDNREMLRSSFYLENADITYSGHIDSLETYFWNPTKKLPVVRGSETQDLYVAYRKSIEPLTQKSHELDERYLKVYHLPALEGIFNTDEGVAIVKEMDEYGRKIDSAQKQFITRNSSSIVAYDLAFRKVGGMDINLTTEQIDELTEIIAKGWGNYPEKLKEFREQAAKAKTMALGVKYPDIELINREGKKVMLSEYVPEGQYAMLEFWASWCGPCRGEIPHLRHVYREYKDKGFEIVSISLDQRKEDWDKAMKEEDMVWKQLCDDKGFKGPVGTTYRVSGVPTCILLDKEGRIFKTGMRGANLDAVLREIYN